MNHGFGFGFKQTKKQTLLNCTLIPQCSGYVTNGAQGMEIWNDESNALASSTAALQDKWIIAKGRFEALSVAATEGFG